MGRRTLNNRLEKKKKKVTDTLPDDARSIFLVTVVTVHGKSASLHAVRRPLL